MYKIALINMPFANVALPSIALTQLKSVLEERFGDRVAVRILYFNHELAHYLGLSLYSDVSNSLESNMVGLGDWFFRDIAFPGLPDNSEEYFQRFFPQRSEAFEMKKRLLLQKRRGLDGYLSRLIAKHHLAGEDMVGFTSMFSQNVASFAMARKLKAKNPALVTVVGGANCEAPMAGGIAAHIEPVDFVFSGPALHSFPEFVGHLLDGEPERCHDVQGVLSKRNLSPERLAGPRSIGEELSIDVPVPLDYDQFMTEFERGFAEAGLKPILLFETSRGCWWGERAHCTFCGLNGGTMAYRAMAPELAIDLLEQLFARYGDRVSRYQSVDNIMPREYLRDVFPRLQPPPHVSLFYEVKADLKAREMEVLARARVLDLQPGIESLNTGTLKLMRKGTTSFQNIGFLKNCVIYGLGPQWNLLLGFPGETAEVYEKYVADIPSLFHLPPPAGAFPVRFDRYSPYFTQQKEYGLDLHPNDCYRFIYPLGEEVLKDMVYYFVDHNYTATYLATMSEWADRINAQVERWQMRWERADGGLPPRLWLADRERGVVGDTRSGQDLLLEVGPVAARALEYLALPRKPADLQAHLGDGVDAAALLADLLRERLVFEERGLFMSLLLDDPHSLEHPLGPHAGAMEQTRQEGAASRPGA